MNDPFPGHRPRPVSVDRLDGIEAVARWRFILRSLHAGGEFSGDLPDSLGQHLVADVHAMSFVADHSGHPGNTGARDFNQGSAGRMPLLAIVGLGLEQSRVFKILSW